MLTITQQNLNTVRNFLTNFINTGEVESDCCGLCFNMRQLNIPRRVSELLSDRCTLTWPKYSGNPMYPILDEDESNGANAQYKHHADDRTLYTGEQLELRISLAQHLLGCLNSDEYFFVTG